jgi:hypothetical protein
MLVLSLLSNLAAFPVTLFRKTRSVSCSCLTLLGSALNHACPLTAHQSAVLILCLTPADLLVVFFTYSCSMVQVWEWSVCRGLTRATYIPCIEHPRPKRLSQESNLGPPALQANILCKEPFEWRYWLQFGTSACITTAPPQAAMSQAFDWGSWLSLTRTRGGPNSTRGSKVLEPLLRAREQGARTSEPCENCIMSGSPLCRGLTRATYILCIEHPRPKRLSRESNPGPPALQANTLCKEPFERLYWLLFGTADCTTTSLQFSSSAPPWLTSWWSSLLIPVPWFRFGNGQFAVLILCLTLADLLVVFCGVLGALILEVNPFFFFVGGGEGW